MEPPHRAPPPHGAELVSCSPRPQARSGEHASGKRRGGPYLNHVPELLSRIGPPNPRLPNRHGAAPQPLSRMEGVCLLLAALSAAAPGQGAVSREPAASPAARARDGIPGFGFPTGELCPNSAVFRARFCLPLSCGQTPCQDLALEHVPPAAG
ncbi:uncharacterized protein ACIBXB_002072 [Morphnus guianensis]